MILSIFKYSLLLVNIFLAVFIASCSHEKKIAPIFNKESVREEQQKYFMGPEHPSSVFIDKTEEYGLKNVQAVHLYAVDINHDGYTDLVTLDDFYAVPKFYFFDSKVKKFILGISPFDNIVRASYLNFVDFDHDGIYDVIVGTLNQKSELTQYPPRIFKGQIENRIVHYKEKSSLPTGLSPTASIVSFDYDLDGEIDLFLGNWFSYKEKSPVPFPDILLKGKEFEFSDVSSSLKGEYEFDRREKNYPNATPTFGVSVCDIDKNGLPDILTSNSNGFYNKLWMNIDGKNFVNYGNESGHAADNEGSQETHTGGNSFFSLCGDYNNDGFIDIVNGTMFRDNDPETRDKSSILTGFSRSFPPKFIRSEFIHDTSKKTWSEGDHRGVWIDYNLDGLTDLIIDNSGFPPDSRLVLFEQEKDHAYLDKSDKLGINIVNPSGTVTIDLKKNGIMSFITGQSKTRAGDVDNHIYVFENQTQREGRGSVRFHLQGEKSNYHGLSSSVWLITNKKTRFFNVEYNSGPLASQNEEGVYFSYNKEIPKIVEVHWSYANVDRLGHKIPLVKKYNLSKFKLKGTHQEFNLCEDGRILISTRPCN